MTDAFGAQEKLAEISANVAQMERDLAAIQIARAGEAVEMKHISNEISAIKSMMNRVLWLIAVAVLSQVVPFTLGGAFGG